MEKFIVFHSFIFTTTSSLERVMGAAALGGLKILKGFQHLHVLMQVPHRERTKQGQRCNHAT